jgi:hypothetical protein
LDPPDAVSVVDEPAHIVEVAGEAVTAGLEFTVTITVELAVQPPGADPVTVYVIVDVGDATTDAVLVALSAVDGVQVYVFAPDAVKVTFAPLHIEAEDGVIVTLIDGVTFTIDVAVASHPD